MHASIAFCRHLYEAKILLAHNAPPPTDRYGWLVADSNIEVRSKFFLEGPCGLYVGPYHPSIGGNGSSGLCTIGAHSYSYSALPERMKVGRYCSISSGLKVLDSTHPINWVTTSIIAFRPHNDIVRGFVDQEDIVRLGFDPIGRKPYPNVQHDVWIGRDATLHMGVTLGTGCIVAAASVITKDVPPHAVVAGNPAQVVGWRFEPEISHRLLACRWWDYAARDIMSGPVDHPGKWLDLFEARVADGAMSVFAPTTVQVGPSGIIC